MIYAPAAACVLATVVMIWAEFAEQIAVRSVSKMIAAAAFIAFGFAAGAWDSGLPGKLIVGGLLFSAVGDAMLLSREKRPFLIGIGAFLIAHLWYLGAFLVLGLHSLAFALALAAVAMLAAGVWRWLRDHVGSLKPAVLAYITVISTMVAAAIGATAAHPDAIHAGLLMAAVVFFFSDLCVARERFVKSTPYNRLAGLPTYFGAQLLFGWFAGHLTP